MPKLLTDADRRLGLGYLSRGHALRSAALLKPALAKLDKVAIRFFWLDFFSRTPLAPFLLEMADVPARRRSAGLVVGFGINPAVIDLFNRLRHCPPAPEQHHLALKAGDIIREMVVLGIVRDDAPDQPFEFLGRRL